ncbi:hypothetical protein DSL72_001666 [Monilinia vaccinii-corymbosi]|uniref:Uncharacterized protein n=1 Tax=Monilinia vaccinii-corymbosi TaxID=61207 RepID=A0A8A3PAN8_9HELO|nr:hypothetical protein DSL72_001666 [Monilinia vaccinii-corymbosi]
MRPRRNIRSHLPIQRRIQRIMITLQRLQAIHDLREAIGSEQGLFGFQQVDGLRELDAEAGGHVVDDLVGVVGVGGGRGLRVVASLAVGDVHAGEAEGDGRAVDVAGAVGVEGVGEAFGAGGDAGDVVDDEVGGGDDAGGEGGGGDGDGAGAGGEADAEGFEGYHG